MCVRERERGESVCVRERERGESVCGRDRVCVCVCMCEGAGRRSCVIYQSCVLKKSNGFGRKEEE